MTVKRFKRIAREALAQLPEEFRAHVEEIDIVIKARPSQRRLRELGMGDDEDLFGLYEGPALTERSLNDPPELPPRILLFYEPLVDACETDEELRREIMITVLHEVGHHFGLSEEDLERRGFG